MTNLYSLCLFISGIIANSMFANPLQDMKVKNINFYILDKYIETSMVKINNPLMEKIFIVFELDTTKSNRNIITERFKTKTNGNMSFYEWIIDGNVNAENFSPELYSTFFKILDPKENFWIVTQCDTCLKLKNAISHIRIIPYSELAQYFKAMTYIPDDTPFQYKSNILFIP